MKQIKWCRNHGSVIKDDFCEWATIEDRFLAYGVECDTIVAEIRLLDGE